MKYSESFWAATQLSIKSLQENSQKLLLLVYMCDDGTTSVPEEVLHILYHSAVFEGDSETFRKSRKELESRELVKISCQNPEWNILGKQRSWSLHSLQKQFIKDQLSGGKERVLKLSDLKESLVKVLGRSATIIEDGVEIESIPEFSQEEDIRLQSSLCALYFDQQFSKEIRLKLDTPLNERRNNLRRNAIEPITRLLGLPLSGRWTKATQSSAKQIFLKYVDHSGLHINGILDLLAMPISILPMLHALQRVAAVEAQTKLALIDENSGALMKALLDLLGDLSDTSDARVAMAAANNFYELSLNKLHHEMIISSGIVDRIIWILSSDSHPYLQVVCSNILILLTYEDAECNIEMGKHPSILGALVNSLCNEHNDRLQVSAGKALLNTVCGIEENKHKIINYPGVLEQLVKMLSKNDNPALQYLAAKYFAVLTSTEEINQKVVDYPGALEQLVASTQNDNRPEIQALAANALMELAQSGNETTVLTLVNFPGLVEGLVKLLSQDNNAFDLQDTAAVGLRNLATAQADETRRRMMRVPGLLEKFFNALSANKYSRDLGWAYIEAMTYIDPARGNAVRLHSALNYEQRGYANLFLGLNKESLEDLNTADEIEPGSLSTLRLRCTVRARLGAFEGALADSNSIIVKERSQFDLQERGVLRRMMGDFPGALADLNECFELDPMDYEVLKHRSYVKFLMKDESGARSDAEGALIRKPSRDSMAIDERVCLGTTSVEFLNYKLT